MGHRHIVSPGLAKFLVELREGRAWNQSRAADIAARRGLKALTYNALRYLEDGKTRHPDRELLEAVAALYELPVEEVVTRYVAEQYGVKLLPATDAHRKSLPATAPVIPFDPGERRLLQYYRRLPQTLQRRMVSTIKDFADMQPSEPVPKRGANEDEESGT